MKVFSTFSGIGGFELGIIKALWEENIQIIGYSELDKFSSAVLAHCFPNIPNYGDIKQINIEQLPDFDVLVGWSPCQDLSISKWNREGLMGARSGLFFEYVRILRMKKPAFFVLENVASMKNEDKDFISETLGVQPIKINSALLTAQSRNRYYRTNIPNIGQPRDCWIFLEHTLEDTVDEKYFVDWQNRTGKKFYLTGFETAPTTFYSVRTEEGYQDRNRNKELFGVVKESRNKHTTKYIAKETPKANCLTGGIRRENLLIVHKKGGFGQNELAVRMPTPIECERLQGFPDNWTLVPRKDRMMSDTQRYKQIWNAVTVDVIEHIFKALKDYLSQTNQSLLSDTFISPTTSLQDKDTPQYIAYYVHPWKQGFKLATQKAIVQHFAKEDQTSIVETFIETNIEGRTMLFEAISYCKEHNYCLIIANLSVLSLGIDLIFKVKQQLGDLFKSCDLPTSDRLSISIAIGFLQRNRELYAIKSKAAFSALKAQGNTFGSAQNFTPETRQMGRIAFQKKAAANPKKKQLIEIIAKCRAENMSFGQIANELNKKGFTTIRGKPFFRASVRRLSQK